MSQMEEIPGCSCNPSDLEAVAGPSGAALGSRGKLQKRITLILIKAEQQIYLQRGYSFWNTCRKIPILLCKLWKISFQRDSWGRKYMKAIQKFLKHVFGFVKKAQKGGSNTGSDQLVSRVFKVQLCLHQPSCPRWTWTALLRTLAATMKQPTKIQT